MIDIRISDALILRPLTLDDAPMLFSQIDANRSHLREWLPWLDHHLLPVDTNGYIGHSRQQEISTSGIVRGIWFNGDLCGVVDLHKLEKQHRKTEMGYWLGAKFQGQGIMTQAVRAMVDYAFETLKLNRVEIRCAEHNHKSRHIPERLNFTNEGLIRDAEWLYDHFVNNVVYGMLARDWVIDGG